MMRSKVIRCLLIVAAAGLCFGPAAYGGGGTTHAGVNNRDGNASPGAGSIFGHSNIDDYSRQDEQINIDGGKDALVKVLRVNQKNLINDYVVKTFPINNALPIEILGVFRDVVALEGGRAEVIRDKVQKKNWLYVVGPKFLMPYIAEAVKQLDVKWLSTDFDGASQAYYKAKFRDIVEIDDIARSAASSSDNTIELDTVNNAALFIGEPYRAKSYVKYSKVVDQPVPQILLEATVYEVEVSKEMRLGLDYIAWKNGPGRNLFNFTSWGSSHNSNARHATSLFDPFLPNPGSSDTSGYHMGINYLITTAYLDFLEGTGRARVVTSGKILVKNSETGTLSAVDEVLHFRSSPNESNTPVNGIEPSNVLTSIPRDPPERDPEGNPEADVEVEYRIWDRTLGKEDKVEIGFVMEVSPMIAEITTELAISLDVNQIVGQTPSGAPQIRSHSLSTTILVRDGQPFCVGGLKRTEDVKNTAKVPILGSIPVLGWLFGHEATVKRETEMIVVLTPKIRLGTEADFEMASDEDKLVRRQIEHKAELNLPKTEWGFDQWLIGSDM
jgi:type II secretory pathway component GspD/PulD (secretin)